MKEDTEHLKDRVIQLTQKKTVIEHEIEPLKKALDRINEKLDECMKLMKEHDDK